jgi:hypothetical protein
MADDQLELEERVAELELELAELRRKFEVMDAALGKHIRNKERHVDTGPGESPDDPGN